MLDEEQLHWIEVHVLVPTVHAMKRSRRPFRGVLYAGLMITNQGPKVLEYNVRFGDPECQPLLMRLKTDLVDVLEAAAECRLDKLPPLEWDPRPAVCVVMASEGYPGKYQRGRPIRGLDEAAKLPNVKVFHAGTATAGGQIVTDGGRVLGVTALGGTICGQAGSLSRGKGHPLGRHWSRKIFPTRRCWRRNDQGKPQARRRWSRCCQVPIHPSLLWTRHCGLRTLKSENCQV